MFILLRIAFLCVHCGSAFKRRYDLKVHLESHADKILPCPDCGMVFRHLRALNSHKEQHSNINYVCGICNVELKTKLAFREHMRKLFSVAMFLIHRMFLCSFYIYAQCSLIWEMVQDFVYKMRVDFISVLLCKQANQIVFILREAKYEIKLFWLWASSHRNKIILFCISIWTK